MKTFIDCKQRKTDSKQKIISSQEDCLYVNFDILKKICALSLVCVHLQSPVKQKVDKFGYPRLTLEEGPKVKSDHIRRFPAHDFLHVGFTSETSRINN